MTSKSSSQIDTQRMFNAALVQEYNRIFKSIEAMATVAAREPGNTLVSHSDLVARATVQKAFGLEESEAKKLLDSAKTRDHEKRNTPLTWEEAAKHLDAFQNAHQKSGNLLWRGAKSVVERELNRPKLGEESQIIDSATEKLVEDIITRAKKKPLTFKERVKHEPEQQSQVVNF